MEIAYPEKVCKSVRFFAGISQKTSSKEGKRSPQRARIDPSGILSREGAKKGGYFPFSDGDTGISVPTDGVPGRSSVLRERDSRRNIHPICPDLQDRIIPYQEELPCPFGRADPEFPGGHAC